MQQEVSVFLYLGFLDSGKTEYIQETLEDNSMETGERTLLLICEEGENEYAPEKFAVKEVVKVTLESEEEYNRQNLEAIVKKHKIERVFLEFNGTWELKKFFDERPENWFLSAVMTFFDSTTFLNYNRNFRPRVFDKLEFTQLVVFNRFKREYDKETFHKIVRAVPRRVDLGIPRFSEIVYEYPDRTFEYDDLPDPMPFDVNAPIIQIEDRDFAWFYRDLNENTAQYAGKKVHFKGLCAVSKKLPSGSFVLGRHIMTCCEADIAYNGFPVKAGKLADGVSHRDWVEITATIKIEYHSAYRGVGPVLIAEKLEHCEPPEERVVTY